MRARFASLAALGLVLTLPLPALAFCRATTCNLGDPRAGCRTNGDGCETTGRPLSWASECVSFAVQANGSVKLGIAARTLEREVERALSRWLAVDCDGGATPRIAFAPLGAVECSLAEYNDDRANANIVLFEDDEWPYAGGIDTLATTRLRFNPDTGALYDADIELNSAEFEFSVGDPVNGVDLASVLTHELGHFLGLGHSDVVGTTMETTYSATDDSRRSLEPDDVAGPPPVVTSNESGNPASCQATKRSPRIRTGFSGPRVEPSPSGVSGGMTASGSSERMRSSASVPSVGRSSNEASVILKLSGD
jgi:hypothetical protein